MPNVAQIPLPFIVFPNLLPAKAARGVVVLCEDVGDAVSLGGYV